MKDVATGTSPAPANAAEAIRNVVVMLLMSPRFVNHLELAGTPISRARGLPGARRLRDRVAAVVHVLADDARRRAAGRGRRRIAGDRRRLRHAARRACSPTAHARHPLAVLERVDAASRRSPASRPTRPAFMALAEGENAGRRRPRPLGRHGAGGARPDRALHLDAQGDLRRAADHRPVGHAVGRSRAPLRRAAVERQRRLPDASPTAARAGLLQRAALLVSSLETDQPVPPRRVHPAQRSCATPCRSRTRTACRPARSIRRRPARR